MIEGGCFCGFVRYQAEGPLSGATNCHCSMCRRISGAPSVAWVTIPKQGFLIQRGEPAILHSSERASRTFCPRCGTPLTFSSKETPSELDLTIGSLDHPEDVPPEDHTWVSAKLPWVELCDELPQFPRTRG